MKDRRLYTLGTDHNLLLTIIHVSHTCRRHGDEMFARAESYKPRPAKHMRQTSRALHIPMVYRSSRLVQIMLVGDLQPPAVPYWVIQLGPDGPDA